MCKNVSGLVSFFCAFAGLANGLAFAQHHAPPLPAPSEIEKLPEDGGPDWNRLVFETSPYLRQHASNPVDWYPWGEEAFERARREDKPIFLSIGYSTCHWCHVMERESFQDDDVAALLNDSFVCVKVDREERPDVDQVYMNASIATRRSGGWPQTVIMNADGEPFFTASYIPKESRPNRIGLMELLPQVTEAWKENRSGIDALIAEMSEKIENFSVPRSGDHLGEQTLEQAYRGFANDFDPNHGGFGDKPKFPATHHLVFLIRYWDRTGDQRALDMAVKTLDAMRNGAVYDHVGFGFHRYATDEAWRAPHFEKMLYDQALLAMAYAEAYEATKEERFAQAVREVLEYVLRDMTHREGGFYSAEDADSDGEEGKFYTWTVEEVRSILDADTAEAVIETFGLESAGNFDDQATKERTGRNVLFLDDAIAKSDLDWPSVRQNLFDTREKRVRPPLDDKILTDWNGLMIAAMAKGGRILDDQRFTGAAARSAEFIWRELANDDGRLHHRYRYGDAGLPAHLEDYAYFTWGLIELYETTFDPESLRRAILVTEKMLELFWDDAAGGFFMTADDAETLIMRPKEAFDRARPSGNSVAALNLVRLARMTGRTEFERRAREVVNAFAGNVNRMPQAYSHLLLAHDFLLGPSIEIVIAGRPSWENTDTLMNVVRQVYAPRKVVLFRNSSVDPNPLDEIAPYTVNQSPIDGNAAAYVCRNFTCDAPTTDPGRLRTQLTRSRPN